MDATQLSQDLQFVRQAVAKSETPNPRPAPIFIYWGIYVLIGFALIDFAPAISGWFFLGGTLAGMTFSGIIARRTFARAGQLDNATRLRHVIHWFGGMCLAIGAPIAMANIYGPGFSGQFAGQISAIMIGLVYFTAGIHIDRPFMWMGLLLTVGGVCVGLVPHYGWTILGVLLSASLFASALVGNKARPLGFIHVRLLRVWRGRGNTKSVNALTQPFTNTMNLK